MTRELYAACRALLDAPHQEHFAVRLNDDENAALDRIKAECARISPWPPVGTFNLIDVMDKLVVLLRESVKRDRAEPAKETLPYREEFLARAEHDPAIAQLLTRIDHGAPWVDALAHTVLLLSRVAGVPVAPPTPTWEEIRKLPSPWDFNDVSRVGDSAEWRYGCAWCGAVESVVRREFKHPDDIPPHPANECLWVRAHPPAVEAPPVAES